MKPNAFWRQLQTCLCRTQCPPAHHPVTALAQIILPAKSDGGLARPIGEGLVDALVGERPWRISWVFWLSPNDPHRGSETRVRGVRREILTTAERDEPSRLRRENRQLKLEREILSKAAAWFARETDVIPPKGSNS